MRFPQALRITEPLPHLVVEKVDHAGVHFAFDATWLAHEGFRASIPVRCIFSGERQRQQLSARSLVFFDRYRGRREDVSPADITAEHEKYILGDHSAREIARQLHRLENMPHPFDLPMPYYVCGRYAHLYIHAATRDRRDGITCIVIIPDASCALDWLGHVNGTCGDEYELLERSIALLHGEAWRELSERCRHNVAGWCKLRAGEELRLYLGDADHAHHDEGLAGLVLTDQRLIFCKYHHRGQVRRDQAEACIQVHLKAGFADLTLRVGRDVSRMIRLYRRDVESLLAELRESEGLRAAMMP